MPSGAITNYIDVAQLTLYAFWIFFFCLIFYLRREDKREGYPLIGEGGRRHLGFPAMPPPKSFLMPHGGMRYAPRAEQPAPLVGARRIAGYAGSPIEPTGNPLLDGIGPASFSARSTEPELTYESGLTLIAPLRVAREFSIAAEDPDPRGMEVIGADGMSAGVITDLWVDRSETIFRYAEMKLPGVERTVLLPMNFVQFITRRRVRVRALRADQFADIPVLSDPDRISPREEDRVVGYFGGGQLYALPGRMGPVL
jgi:photosynthetic reaction center H subunit